MADMPRDKKYRKVSELMGKNVILRKTAVSHAEPLFRQIRSPGVLENLTIEMEDLTEFRRYLLFIENQWKMNQDFTYTIFLLTKMAENSEEPKIEIPIGQISIYNVSFSNYRGEIGIWLGSHYWNQGLAKESLSLMLKYGFKDLSLNRLQAHIFIENHRSISLFESMGFQREGIIREYVRKSKEFRDVYSYSLLNREYEY